jgi:hypothetical protein
MTRSTRPIGGLFALALLLAAAPTASAQYLVPAPAYYPPRVSYYAAPAPVVSYYPAPAPVVSYYAPPAVSYYPAPVVSYYPAPVYYGPSAVTTYYRYGLLGRRVGATTYYYP